MHVYEFLHSTISQIKYRNVVMLQTVTALNRNENVTIMIKRYFDEYHLRLFTATGINEANENFENVKLLLRHLKKLVAVYRLGYVAIVLLRKDSHSEFVYNIFQWNKLAYIFSSVKIENSDYYAVKCEIVDPDVDIEDVVRDFNVALEVLNEHRQKYIIEEPSPFLLEQRIKRKQKIQKFMGKEEIWISLFNI